MSSLGPAAHGAWGLRLVQERSVSMDLPFLDCAARGVHGDGGKRSGCPYQAGGAF